MSLEAHRRTAGDNSETYAYIFCCHVIIFTTITCFYCSSTLNCCIMLTPHEFLQVIEDDGVEESQEDAIEVEPDGSIDSGVLVNGNDGEEHWGMNNEGTSSA